MSLSKIEQISPFHFYIDIGNYTGISAASYEGFLASIKKVDAKSLSFHVNRGDFEKWALNTLKDEKLAKEIGKLKNRKLHRQLLRNHLYRTVSDRHKELNTKNK